MYDAGNIFFVVILSFYFHYKYFGFTPPHAFRLLFLCLVSFSYLCKPTKTSL